MDERSIIVTGGFTNYTIQQLEPGNNYTITVTAFNAAGRGPVSNSITAITLAQSEIKDSHSDSVNSDIVVLLYSSWFSQLCHNS